MRSEITLNYISLNFMIEVLKFTYGKPSNKFCLFIGSTNNFLVLLLLCYYYIVLSFKN